MLEQVVNSSNFDYLQRGLQAATLRHEVISNNIANVNTPRFKKSNVIFEELLARELEPEQEGQVEIVRTHDRHLPVLFQGKASAIIQEEKTDTMRVDGNNVDIDAEMAGLAKNQLYYNALATQLRGYVRRLKDAISSGQSS
ncbi:MAG: flagellar basal body rod protein FlgB [Selenomonadaceae bacterium]|nr:flagellar basal body rod protein FlgB [Selenomonadaceae bacterium]MBR4696209.1 flagellar basal body rod protein FlgB [Selenomonadaceae bacterium]